MYEYKRSVEKGKLLPNLIAYLFWVCLLILSLSLHLCQTTQKINDLTHVVLEQSFDGLTPLQIEKMLESLKQIFKNLAR